MMRFLAKALGHMRHSGRSPWQVGYLARTRFDYAGEVGTGIDSSVVTAPVQWIQRAYPEGRLRVMRGAGDKQREIENHPLVELIGRPNPHYGDGALWSATIFSYCVAGNAYWLKVRNGAGKVGELWYVPHWTVAPKWPDDGSSFISSYDYRPGGGSVPISLAPEDVIHFRHGIDPRNPRLGLSPLHGVIREIFMDMEASNFIASLLRNMAVPGVVISPDGGTQPAPDDVEAVKAWFRDAFGGDKRGEPLVMGGATKVQQYGFTPQQMDLSVARDVAEERVCACLGIPAAVVGFGAGLQTAKVGATMGELRKLAWHNGIIPLMRAFADELQRSAAELAAARRQHRPRSLRRHGTGRGPADAGADLGHHDQGRLGRGGRSAPGRRPRRGREPPHLSALDRRQRSAGGTDAAIAGASDAAAAKEPRRAKGRGLARPDRLFPRAGTHAYASLRCHGEAPQAVLRKAGA